MADIGGESVGGSVLLGCIAQSFRNILQRDFDDELLKETKEKEKRLKARKKKKDKDKKDKTEKKETDKKTVTREGSKSLITYSNPSAYSVFSHIRHFVLQQELCDTYNIRNLEDSDESEDDEDDEEGKTQEKQKTLPEVVNLGIRGVFSILQEVWQTTPELCLRVLSEFLNILQGQSPGGLKNEPPETTAALFDLLMKIVTDSTMENSTVAKDLSCMASSCLLSLVIALGETSKMLAAVASLLIAPSGISDGIVKVPEILRSLQVSVQAVLVGAVCETDWYDQGVPVKSLVDQWSLTPVLAQAIDRSSPAFAIASDARFLYLHGAFGLMKIGSGYGNTIKGHVYNTVSDFHNNTAGRLLYASSKLYFASGQGTITVIDPQTLKTEETMELEVEAIGPQCLFSDGTDLRQIMAKKDGSFVLHKLTTICSPIPVVEQKVLQLSQKSVLCLGRAKYDTQSTLHTLYQDNTQEVVRIMATKSFSIVVTATGKVFYQGSGVPLGITGKDIPKGQWAEIDLPESKSKVEYCACDNSGSFCLLVTDKGTVYFGGVNKKGEAGENPSGGRQPKPVKLKKMNKVKEHEIVSCACGPHTSALISRDGKLFMFGLPEDDLVDKNTGVVTGMLGVPASQVVLGRSHTCVLTQLGTVFTFGNNQYGQCGRNYIPPSEGQNIEVTDEDAESSDEDEGESMCLPGEHTWGHERCMICHFCKFCTGYGPSCCNEGLPGRDPGMDCGCGSGDSGCTSCGCCKVCAGETDSWSGGISFQELEEVEPEMFERIRRARSRKEKKGKEKKEDKGGGEGGASEGGGSSDQDDNKEEKVEDLLSTKKPAILPLSEEQTVMQIDCGTFHTALLLHTGEVYMFGNGNHGQLGQGNNKPCGHPVKVPLPGPAQQVACGDNHTVVLLTSGEVYTFGKHQEGQLGRDPEDADDNSWNMIPGPISMSGDSCQAKWVSASGNQTFIAVDESLISENTLQKCQIFAHPECFGLVPPSAPGQLKPSLIVINPSTCVARKMDGEDQQNLTDRALCVDPEYNVLWTYSPSSLEVNCFNPVASEVKDSSGTILSPSLCLPQSKEATITRTHAAMNLLSSLHTLAINPPMSLQSLTGKKMKNFSVDDYHILTRFNSHGGGWGYNAGSIEAIRFSPDQDVLLGGFGLYGGRGSYNAEIKVMELGQSSDPETEGTLLASAEEKGYSCERNKTYRLLFDRPVVLMADNWYIAHVMIVSPSGASTDAGSSGQSQVSGPDKVVFKFKNSRKSNNGTDVGSGQIPEFLYRIPEFEQESGVSIQLLEKEFSLTVSPDGLQAAQNILEWGWDQLLREPEQISQLNIVIKSALGILSSHIKEVYPAKGINKKALPDSPELAECVHKTLWLIKRIFSSKQSSSDQFKDIMTICRETFTSCFHAFYPSALLKWFALCNLLQQIDPSDIIVGFPGDNLLSAILEALSSPSYSYIGLNYDNSYSFETAMHNSSQEERFPILTEYMHQKTMEEFSTGGELLSFTAVSSKLLALVSGTLRAQLAKQVMPFSVVVQKAGEFLISRSNELALCSSYPEVAALTGLPLTSSKKKEKILESTARFSSREVGFPALSVTDVTFSVNKPILLNGFGVFGGSGDSSYTYEISILKDGTTIGSHKGSFDRSDYYGDNDLVNLMFPEPLKLEPEVIYIARVDLVGPSFTIGSEGEMNISGPGGVVFTLHSTGLPESDPETGPVTKFLYSSPSGSPQNIVQLSVNMASMLLDLTVGFLERVLRDGPTVETVEIFSSSFLVSNLLPTTLAHLGPIASLQPKSSVAILDMVQRTLPVVSTAVQELKNLLGETNGYLDAKLTHYALVETDHPYKPASVSHFRVRFPDQVQWMSLEFDPKCGFAQQEDKLASLLIPRKKAGDNEAPPTTETVVSSMIGINLDDLYSDFQHFGLDTPAGLVLIPGNEVHIIVNTETEYEKRDKSNHYGIKCQLIGYEWSTDSKQCLSLLEKELVTLGAMCAGALLSEDLNLPYPEELPVSYDPNDSEKADMRIVQAAAQEVLSSHSHLLNRGLYANLSSPQTVLRGDVPLITNSAEQQFLQDFIKSKAETPGGRLARWLQPDRSVDPNASDLELKTTDTPIVGKQIEFIVRTRDHDNQVVFVEGMNVEVKAEWKGKSSDEEGSMKGGVDRVTGVRRPTYKRLFNPTMLGTNHVYQSISMMMPYSDYSFEELRFYAPKVLGSVDCMAVTSHKDGTYTVTWVPTSAGSYDIRVCIDGSVAGDGQTYNVLPPETSPEETERESDKVPQQPLDDKQEEETVVVEVVKKKTFTGLKAAGLRVRAQPSFAAPSIALIKPGMVLSYSEEIENDAGRWIKLSNTSLIELKCMKREGYALSYSKAKNDDFLEDVEPEEIKRVVKKKPGSYGKRIDGPGIYSIVQCGAAGHNVRSKPNMKGSPIGRLAKGNKIEAIEEVENDDGIWLKLSPDSLKKHTQSDSEGWTLVVHPSGRIFLTQEGDESYKAFESPSTSSAQAYPTAASVFGTPQTSIFGSTEPPPPPPPPPAPGGFKFGSASKGFKLAFGKESGEPKQEETTPPLFRFTSSPPGDKTQEDSKETNEGVKLPQGPVFSIGIGGGESSGKHTRSKSPRRKRGPSQMLQGDKEKDRSPSPEESPSQESVSSETPLPPKAPKVAVVKRQALSPAVAECQRAIFASFLWQEGLVHDAIASAVYLKFHPELLKEKADPSTPEKKDENDEQEETDVKSKSEESLSSPLPSTLNHLVIFWDEISQKVIDNSSVMFAPPKVPSYAQELQKRYEEEKKEMEKLKKEKEKKSGGAGGAGGGGGGGGSTLCELCDITFPDPVTYHMKEIHPGCGKHANGWGYNSRGSYCSGWAGNCGDGGRGGSTWYLMCKDCHSKYLSLKEENKRKVTKPVTVPKMKTRKPGKPRSLPVIPSVQGMIQNAKFLLEVTNSGEGAKPKLSSQTSQPDFARQISTPDEVKEKTLSLPRPQEKAKEAPLPSAHLTQRPPLYTRSMSMATDARGDVTKRTYSDSGENGLDALPSLSRQKTLEPTVPGESSESSSLMTKPSMALAKLMYLRSRQSKEGKETGYNRVMSFVTQYHDLQGLKATMKQMMRIAGLRAFALEFLGWLIQQVQDPSVIHDILWQFIASMSDHPMIQAAAQAKAERDKEEKGDKETDSKDWSLGRNPLTGLDGAGTALVKLRTVFHSFLQTIANAMSKLPVGSIAQQMALKCWCLDFQPQDHSFLLQSQVFANISEALSGMEEVEGEKQPAKQMDTLVELMINVLSNGKVKVSSNDAMSNSLTDGSTETFWESRDEPRGKPRSITVTYDKVIKIFAASIHIDNQKDSGQRVEQLSLFVGPDEDSLKEVDKCKLATTHAGWKTLIVPEVDEQCKVVRFELRGVQNNIRARQVIILGRPDKPAPNACPTTAVAMQKDCETEALRLFRLLTSQVFGGLLLSTTQPKEGEEEETDSNLEQTEEETSSMANILFNKSRLSGLQKAVCQHIMDSVHTEASRMKEEWEKSLKEPTAPKVPPARQASHDPSTLEGVGSRSKGPDTYCYELLTMLEGLSQSELGCNYLAGQSQLIQDLVSLLHTASGRIKLQVCSLLRRILPYIKPRDFATMTNVTVLPPLGYSAIAEAVNSAATINQLGLLDCLLAVIAKALSVQVKVKGRGSNILQKLTGDTAVAAVTLATLKDPKPVVGEAHVRGQRWYLQGSIEQEVAIEIVKLLKDMMKSVLKGQWKDYAKSAIGQAVLHLTKINEEARNADPGMYSHTFWLCLAALCVIDEEHADALSSGQWLGQDGKPQTKPLCDNHDDGETKALILCDHCGNLCGECDRVLHYHKRTDNHQRQVFKEEEEAVKVDLHEGCGRIKLYWTMALADSRTLKGMVEFKDTVGGGGKGACRFCGTTSNTGLLAIGNVCADPECQERAKSVCDKSLSCGHLCCGVKGEKKCLPCLHGCGTQDDSTHPPLKQDADDMCMICYTEGLSCAPAIQLECGHVFHYQCCHNALSKKWSGPRITFRFMFCSICEDKPIAHPHLSDVATPLSELYDDVKRKCQLRLEYENQSKCEAITSPSSKFYQKPLEYAMWKYAYYVCYKCKKAYYGGEAHCAEAVGASDDYDPTELVCPACSNTGGQVQICPKHGTDFLEYKCRYCCSVAVYFCFGTTHFCNPCHDDFQRLTSMPKSELPQCPVGPRAKPLSGTECPLHVKHPPTGDEFALGCGVCRNAQTF